MTTTNNSNNAHTDGANMTKEDFNNSLSNLVTSNMNTLAHLEAAQKTELDAFKRTLSELDETDIDNLIQLLATASMIKMGGRIGELRCLSLNACRIGGAIEGFYCVNYKKEEA